MTTPIEDTLAHVARLLAQKRYTELERQSAGRRLTANEIESAITDYGGTIVAPLASDLSRLDVVPIRNTRPQAYSIRFRLQTLEEGESDLELQATFIENASNDLLNFEIDNIVVP